MSAHVVQWVSAAPLWPHALRETHDEKRRRAMRKPTLLRFERDSFMQDVAKLLETDPASLKDHVATKKSYRLPAPGETEPPAPAELKLYQAVHGHFNLVAATLVCRLPGLPEHDVATAQKETVSFVLRRLDDTKPETEEWAWVDDPAAHDGKSWVHLDKDHTGAPADGEDLLPLFPVRYTTKDARVHKLFVGLIPTQSSDAFKAAGTLSPVVPAGNSQSGAASADPRPDALRSKVTDPLRLLQAAETQAPADAPSNKQQSIRDAMTAQRVEASQFLLLDFAEFLRDELGWFADDTWTEPSPSSSLWSSTLDAATVPGGPKWRDALLTAWRDRKKLSGDAQGTSTLNVDLHRSTMNPDTLDTAVASALPQPYSPPSTAAVSVQGDVAAEPPPVPKLDSRGASRYVLRCVYRRPECGALCPDVVSARSDAFQIAGFFDLDAPARSITIAMPVDTSIKDLRKLKKNVSFLLSNELRQQMNRVTSLKDALDGKFADGESLQLGLLCSFSIPIITICALIVLMIFISLLNIVFWWMPFLRICFPIALKAK